jgi:hypothetical protein
MVEGEVEVIEEAEDPSIEEEVLVIEVATEDSEVEVEEAIVIQVEAMVEVVAITEVEEDGELDFID